MMMKSVVLAGGSGKRLWPLSREMYPKQFMSLDTNGSLLQQTVERVGKYAEETYIVTNSAQYEYVKHQLEGKIKEERILTEPIGRNTAPAIALACTHIQNEDDSSKILVMPSDHLITENFFKIAKKAEACTTQICLFGITPTHPATGYGYIMPGEENGCGFNVQKFIEKPEQDIAKKLITDNCLWNSGIFLFDTTKMMEEYKTNLPEIYKHMSTPQDLLDNYHKLPNTSIDHGIIEKSRSTIVFPFNGEWSDIGSWNSIYEILPKDENNNAMKGKIITHNSKNSLLWSEDRLIATVGLKDMIIVSTHDALLVAHKTEAEQIKSVVEELKNKNYKEAFQHTTVHRPWGYYTILEKGPMYKVKRLCVRPGKRLSRQLHHHRAEHWIIVKGTAKVVKDGEEELFLHENESIYVPKSVTHRIENPGKINLHIIEVQTGGYLEEDDIVRFDKHN